MTAATTGPESDGSLVHEALIYRDPEEYLRGTVPFVRAALEAGEPVLVAVPAANLRLLGDKLGAIAHRVRLVDMSDVGRNPGRILPAVLHTFVAEHPASRVRIVGEPIWAGRSADAYPACVQHEALINVALADRAATILCPYDARRLAPSVIEDALRTHPVLVEADERRVSPGFAAPAEVVASFNRPLPPPSVPPRILIFAVGGLRRVRGLVGEVAAAARLAAERVLELQIAVNEVATNAVIYGSGTATLRTWADDAGVVCEVTDSGEATDPLIGRTPPGATAAHGRGLVLVNLLCDLVRVHTGAGTITVRMHAYR